MFASTTIFSSKDLGFPSSNCSTTKKTKWLLNGYQARCVCVCIYIVYIYIIYIYIYLREPQHTPGAYPRHPQTLKWKEFHKQMVEGLGYVPGVCWKILWIYAYYTLPETNTAPDTKCLEYDPFLLKKTLVQQGRNSLLVSGSVLISISCLSVWSFQLPLL